MTQKIEALFKFKYIFLWWI